MEPSEWQEEYKRQRAARVKAMKARLQQPGPKEVKLVEPSNYEVSPEDIRRIQRVLDQVGLDCSLVAAEQLWLRKSETLCASWTVLPESDEALLDTLLFELDPAEVVGL